MLRGDFSNLQTGGARRAPRCQALRSSCPPTDAPTTAPHQLIAPLSRSGGPGHFPRAPLLHWGGKNVGKRGWHCFFLEGGDDDIISRHGGSRSNAVTVASGRQLFWRPRPRLRSLVPVTPAANPSERLGTRASGCAHWCHAWRQRRPILLNA